jgi:hypothetical protein
LGSWAAGYGLGAYRNLFTGEISVKKVRQMSDFRPVFQIFPSVFCFFFMSCIFKINFCRWWGLEHFTLFDGALGNEIKNSDVSWGQKKFF